jgi:hypothetical protein
MRYAQFVRRQASDGRLSSREAEEYLERIFRADSVQELEEIVSALPGAKAVSLDSAIAGEWHTPTKSGSWFQRLVIFTLIVDATGVLIWALTGGGLIWIVLLFMFSALAFAWRVMRRDDRRRLGHSFRSRRRGPGRRKARP